MEKNLHFYLSIDIDVRNEIQEQFLIGISLKINIPNDKYENKNVFCIFSGINNVSARFFKNTVWTIMYFQKNFISGII